MAGTLKLPRGLLYGMSTLEEFLELIQKSHHTEAILDSYQS